MPSLACPPVLWLGGASPYVDAPGRLSFVTGAETAVTGVETAATQATSVSPVVCGVAVCSHASLGARRSATEAREGFDVTELARCQEPCCDAHSQLLLRCPATFPGKVHCHAAGVHLKWYSSEQPDA